MGYMYLLKKYGPEELAKRLIKDERNYLCLGVLNEGEISIKRISNRHSERINKMLEEHNLTVSGLEEKINKSVGKKKVYVGIGKRDHKLLLTYVDEGTYIMRVLDIGEAISVKLSYSSGKRYNYDPKEKKHTLSMNLIKKAYKACEIMRAL